MNSNQSNSETNLKGKKNLDDKLIFCFNQTAIPFVQRCYLHLPIQNNGTPLQYFCLENPMDGGAW